MKRNKSCRKRLLALLLSLALVCSLAAGCGGQTQPQSQPQSQQPQSSQPAQPEPSQAQPEPEAPQTVTVTDMAGRTVTLPAKIGSIATFGSIGVINAFVELMGCGDLICNDMTASFTKSDKWAMQYQFAPQIAGAPVLQNADGEIDMEAVLKLAPDLCLVMSKDLIEPQESNGLNVVYFEWKQTDDVKAAVTLMGETLGKQDVAADYLAYFDSMASEAAEKTAGITEKKTVLYGSIDKLTQPHVIAEWWIDAAGGVSVTADSWVENKCTYTQEDILKWDPQVMITTDLGIKDTLTAAPLYSDVTAVKAGAIYYIPTVAHVWGNRTVEQPLTVFWTMNKLYPEVETTEDLTEKISYFYDHFFHCKLTDEQISAIIGA